MTQTEENYLKAIYKVCERSGKPAGTNAVAERLATSAASVTDMFKRLAEKELLVYEKHKGVELSTEGERLATLLIRRHRLWEVFLTEKLDYQWDEVHELAEQLEHIQSDTLIDRLDTFLGEPRFDPHGDPIPDRNGHFAQRQQRPLAQLKPGDAGTVVGVAESSTAFLQYLDKLRIQLGVQVRVEEIYPFDQTIAVRLDGKSRQVLSPKVAQKILVQRSFHPRTEH